MRKLIPFVLILVAYSQAYGQIKIITYDRNEIYGIVVAEDEGSLTIRQKNNFRCYVPRNDIRWFKELNGDIYTYDSIVYHGHIYFDNGDTIFYTTGREKTDNFILRNKVSKIEYDAGEEEEETAAPPQATRDETGVSSSNEPLSIVSKGGNAPDRSYWMLGLTAFWPGGINAVVGRQFSDNIGIRLQCGGIISGDGIPSIAALQLNFLYNLKKTEHFEHNISVGLSTNALDNHPRNVDWYFCTGIFYDINVKGFFVETGLAFNHALLSEGIFTVQVGYVYRFW